MLRMHEPLRQPEPVSGQLGLEFIEKGRHRRGDFITLLLILAAEKKSRLRGFGFLGHDEGRGSRRVDAAQLGLKT